MHILVSALHSESNSIVIIICITGGKKKKSFFTYTEVTDENDSKKVYFLGVLYKYNIHTSH